jgi:hypothetical protein
LVDPQRAERLSVALPRDEPGAAWTEWLGRHPSLELQFRGAEPVQPIRTSPGVIQRRCARAVGARWALLPQAFASFDPLFSTGIAWSLVAVERLAAVLGPVAASGSALAEPAGAREYGERLAAEADQLDRLLTLGYRRLDQFDRFSLDALVYFTLASFSETRQRLLEPHDEPRCRVDGLDPSWAWDGFLGALDPVAIELLQGELDRAGDVGQQSALSPGQQRRMSREAIAVRNLAGLGDEQQHPLYPVDLEAVVEAAPLLGLEPAEVRRRLPRLISPRRFPGSLGSSRAGSGECR